MESCERLTQLLSDVLDISMIESGDVQLKLVEIDLVKELNCTYELFKSATEQKHLDFNLNISPGIPAKVLGDISLINQVFNNLISNAIKFTESGEILITVDSPSVDSEGVSKVKFTISDTGIGIAEKSIESIFDSFTQVDSSKTRNYEGAGLGLAIVKKLVSLLGGEIAVSSAIGEGTSVQVCLPFRVVGENAGANEIASEMNCDFAQGLNILVAEDEKINQLTLESFLNKCGCSVTIADDGIEVIDILNASDTEFDLIFMDIQMPNLGGHEVIARIRAGEAGDWGFDVPIIACTAHAMKGDREECLSAGMNDYLSKPIHINDIENILAKYFNPPK